jgi:hypothetical protein
MKKTALWLALITAFFVGACTGSKPKEGQPAYIEREALYIYIDGVPSREGGYKYSDISSKMKMINIAGTDYYAATVEGILGKAYKGIKGAFLESLDGQAAYTSDAGKLIIAAFAVEDGEYIPVGLNGAMSYAGVIEGGGSADGVSKVYLLTKETGFDVEIQRDGVKIGSLSLEEFMKATPVGDETVPTAMYDGSFLYNSGSATYEGRFLGISFDIMLAKLESLGMHVSAEGTVEAEFYGTNGTGNVGKNFEYSANKDDPKYYGSTSFFCMFDGMAYNSITTDIPIGLSAFINGTGSRWVTYSLQAINFVTETEE